MSSTLLQLADEFSNPYLDAYYLAGDTVKNTIEETHSIAAQEKQICDDLCGQFDAVTSRLSHVCGPKFVKEDRVSLCLYYKRGQQPLGWHSINCNISNLSYRSIRVNNEWLVAYAPEALSRDDKILENELKKLQELRQAYSPLASKLIHGEAGSRHRWHHIMWGTKFDLQLNQYGLAEQAPLIYQFGENETSYILGFSFKSSDRKEGRHQIPPKLEGKIRPISAKVFNRLNDGESSVSQDWRLSQIRDGHSGLTLGERIRFMR